MEIKEDHKGLLKSLGLKDEDFELFDGEFVRYEYDEQKGVRIYDPYYRTSYDEYIGVDGWSAWGSEEDTFMQDILKGAREEAERREKMNPNPNPEDITKSVQEKFGETDSSDSSE